MDLENVMGNSLRNHTGVGNHLGTVSNGSDTPSTIPLTPASSIISNDGNSRRSRNRQNLPFIEQINLLQREREQSIEDLELLGRIQQDGMVRIRDLQIDLIPAINNQKKANVSLKHAVRKFVRFTNPVVHGVHEYPGNQYGPTPENVSELHRNEEMTVHERSRLLERENADLGQTQETC